MDAHGTLCRAIRDWRVVRLTYKGHVRVVEPHDYGRIDGEDTLFCYQTGGGSDSGGLPQWRRLRFEGIRGIERTDQTFQGPRPVPSGKHLRWDALYASVRDEGAGPR